MSDPTHEPAGWTTASHVIAGFRYQLLHSVVALMTLRPNERLILEAREDYSVETQAGATDFQVKGSQAARGPTPFSLQSSAIREVLERFWNHPSTASPRRLVFMARGGAAKERDYEFPDGVGGLDYWARAAIDADTLPLRKALKGTLAGGIQKWLNTDPTDEELRERLLRRVNWQLALKPAEALFEQVRQQARDYYFGKGWPVSAATNAANALITLAMEVASRQDVASRTLSPVDLAQALEEAAGPVALAEASTPAPSVSSSSHDLLISELEGGLTLAARRPLVEELSGRIVGQNLVWVHGAHGVGKSMLAYLLAAARGGRWVIVDLWSVQKDGAAAVSVWRDLLRTVRDGEELSGIIVEDLDGPAGDALQQLVAALAQSLGSRGARVIVTSHHQPSAARMGECGGTVSGIVAAPYFSEEDITELVSMAPSPAADMVRPWSLMLSLTTGGGHPLLVSAKIASLRARGWPGNALLEDLAGNTSEPVQLTRDEQRRKLIDDLKELDDARSLEAGQLLRRIASVFDRADEALVRKLILGDPALPNGGDAFAVLKGSWLEVLPRGDLRVSPLLGDITSDVAPEDGKRWRRIAAEHWLSTRTLNERTLPLCFWNAFLGEHDGVLAVIVELIASLDKDRLRGVAPLLSPLAAFRTDKPIYDNNALIASFIRMLQFDIADALSQGDIAAKAAERILVETAEVGHEDISPLLTTVAASKVLSATGTRISPKLRSEFALRLRAEAARSAELFGDRVPDRSHYLPPWYPPGLDMADFLFSMIVQHIRTANDVLETVRVLDELPVAIRNGFLDAIDATYSGIGVFVNAGWANEQNTTGISENALDLYEQAERISRRWNRQDVEVEMICARSVIWDERLGNQVPAAQLIENAMLRFGRLPQLLRQKAKVAAHSGELRKAAELMLEIENDVGTASPLDRALALRDAAVYAAKSGLYSDGIRLLEKAHVACTQSADYKPLAVGLLIEKALVLWRNGDRRDAVAAAADAFDGLSEFSATESRQAERSHMYARALVGLFFDELLPTGGMKAPPFTFGAASSVELNSAQLLGADLKSVADNYRVLVAVESALGLDIGTETRSLTVQGDTLNVGVETAIALNRFEAALRRFDVDAAMKAAVQITAMANLRSDPELQERFPFSTLAKLRGPLAEIGEKVTPVAQSAIVDVILAGVLSGREPSSFLPELDRAIEEIFGPFVDLHAVVASASGGYAVTANSPFYLMVAQAVVGGEAQLRQSPLNRMHRDLMMLSHLAHSMGRSVYTPAAASAVHEGWKWVWENQRFMLGSPIRLKSEVEDALRGEAKLSTATTLLLAFSRVLKHGYADDWFKALKPLTRSNP